MWKRKKTKKSGSLPLLAWGVLSCMQSMGKLSTGASLWGQDGSGLPCWAAGLSGEVQSQQPRQVVLEMVFNITWQESCPALLQPLSIPAPGVLCLSALSLAAVPGVSHLLKGISSISAHRRGERELFRAVQHSCKLWYLWLLFLSRAEMLWRVGMCCR